MISLDSHIVDLIENQRQQKLSEYVLNQYDTF